METRKLETIGRLAAGIAHEINTPTQYVGDNLRFLQDSLADLTRGLNACERLLKAVEEGTTTPDLIQDVRMVLDELEVEYLLEEIPKAIQQSLQGIERVSAIVQAMKEFSHPDTDEKTPTNLNHAISSTITIARNEWKYVADLETDFDPNLPPVPCLPGEFNQVILNLIVNAAHAIGDALQDQPGEKGKITIRTRYGEGYAEVQVQDTGTGIPDEIRTKIFEPFFTTKEVGKGTGQGLAIARSVIADKHGGTITFETEAGKGTTFVVRLPLVTLKEAAA